MIESQRSQVRDRIAGAIGRIEGACREELRNFCSTVTPGEGRLCSCMQAHEDKLQQSMLSWLCSTHRAIFNRRCRKSAVVAEARWTDIQMQQCGGDSSIAQCISETTRQLVTALQAPPSSFDRPRNSKKQHQPALAGTPIFSAGWRKVGEVTAVRGGL